MFKVSKKLGLILCLEDTFLGKTKEGGESHWPPLQAFLGSNNNRIPLEVFSREFDELFFSEQLFCKIGLNGFF